ncbi:hypothetical protein A3F64_01855 [Candidatus Saccharibacteria bacterium RIFCSPHIGHO2_12_FULL_42_8]|nr:MAG: hypothetical protein A3F64_01855 [Candidatus Saccharibacteria bacterium RIFCSPHIGHO2_12_FULL_42_8]
MIQIAIPKFPPSAKKAADVEQMARLFLDPQGHRKVITKVNAQQESQGKKPWIFNALEHGDTERKREALLACYWYMLEQARLGALQMFGDSSSIKLNEEQSKTLNKEVPVNGKRFGHKARIELVGIIHLVAKSYGSPKPSTVLQMPTQRQHTQVGRRGGKLSRAA